MVNILYIINDFEDNSLNRHAYNLALDLQANGATVYFLALMDRGTIKSSYLSNFKGKIFVSGGSFVKGVTLTSEIARKYKIGIFHTQTLRAEYTTFLAKIFLLYFRQRIVHLANRHNYFFLSCEQNYLLKNGLYFLSCHFTDLNICVANHLNNKLINSLRVPKQKVTTVFNGVQPVDTDLIRRHNSSSPLIIFTGKLVKRKNVSFLLKALSRITLPYKCLIIGDGPERPRLARYVNEQKLENKIYFIPFTTNINKYLSKADIFVLPSLSEGMSISLLEAMSYGLGCVVSSILANIELIGHNHDGLVFPIDQKNSNLSWHLEKLISSPDLIQKLGSNARKKIMGSYTEESMLKSYQAIYSKLATFRLKTS